jgi:hypothetical protein
MNSLFLDFRKKFYVYLFVVTLFFPTLKGSSQVSDFMNMGHHPSSVKWKYYQTPAAKIIFPDGNDSQAVRVANVLNYIYDPNDSLTLSVGKRRKHLTMIVQTNQVVSNGYVGLSPYRSEFFGTGTQNLNQLGTTDWLDLLSLHEYRHALQYVNGRRGLTQLLYWLGGENFWGVAYGLSVPDWYAEGDAVQTETVLSPTGRGRTPYFFKEQKALLFNNKKYTYMKARNGSFRSLLPNQYPFGYAMMQYVRNQYGAETWKHVLAKSGYRSVFYPFSMSLRRQTKLSTRRLYKQTYAQLKKDWEEELAATELIPTTVLTEVPKRVVTNYEWPHQLKDGSLVYLKNAYNELRFLVQLKDGQENQLAPIGAITETFLSVNNNRAAWTEMTTDPRWQNRNYNDIVTYDFDSHIRKKLTCKTKLFSPEFSSSGEQLIAVKADEQLRNQLVFIDAQTGKETGSIDNPDNLFLCYPHWTADDQSIIYIAKRKSQVAIIKYDITSKTNKELTPWSYHVIGAMYVGKERVYFNASYSGINNIYTVTLNGDKEIKQLTSVKISAEMPGLSADEQTLFMSEFDVMGFKITSQAVQLENAKPVVIKEPADMEVFKIKTTIHEKNILDNVPSRSYVKKNYRGWIRDPKLHSWGLTSFGISGNGILAQGTLQVDNVLNDFSLAVAGGYNANESAWNTNVRLSYARFYLPFYIEGIKNQRKWKQGDLPSYSVKYTEEMIGGDVGLPLSWIRGPWKTSLKWKAGVHQIITSNYSSEPDFKGYNFTSGSVNLEFSNLLQKAKQHVAPRFGQSLSVSYNQSIFSSHAFRFLISGTVYFPGIGKNHSISVTAAYKNEPQSNRYDYVDVFEHARGFLPVYFDQAAVLRTNYQLPLVYPDAGFGGILYLQRIRLNLFMDNGNVKYNDKTILKRAIIQQSVGTEFLFDITVFNVLPLSIGVRYAAAIQPQGYNKQLLRPWQVYLASSF